MGLYAKYLLPRIIDLAMRNEETARLRAAWIPLARGEVLEVAGVGFELWGMLLALGIEERVELAGAVARGLVIDDPEIV